MKYKKALIKLQSNSWRPRQFLWRYIYDKIQFTEMAIQLVESDIQQVKFDKKKATKGEKH